MPASNLELQFANRPEVQFLTETHTDGTASTTATLSIVVAINHDNTADLHPDEHEAKTAELRALLRTAVAHKAYRFATKILSP